MTIKAESQLEPMPERSTFDWLAYSSAVSLKRIADALEWQNERTREYLAKCDPNVNVADAAGAGPVVGGSDA